MFALIGIASKLAAARLNLFIVSAMSLALGACAHNVADAPALQWQVKTVEASGDGELVGASDGASSSWNCGRDNPDACYVYRGGRDPKTGLAFTQL